MIQNKPQQLASVDNLHLRPEGVLFWKWFHKYEYVKTFCVQKNSGHNRWTLFGLAVDAFFSRFTSEVPDGRVVDLLAGLVEGDDDLPLEVLGVLKEAAVVLVLQDLRRHDLVVGCHLKLIN